MNSSHEHSQWAGRDHGKPVLVHRQPSALRRLMRQRSNLRRSLARSHWLGGSRGRSLGEPNGKVAAGTCSQPEDIRFLDIVVFVHCCAGHLRGRMEVQYRVAGPAVQKLDRYSTYISFVVRKEP